ncbi:MAG: hypothetical protein U1C74_00330 [Phenylobacterium sp.]|nr:hypothetical protein [Phenylobacterium sp.]
MTFAKWVFTLGGLWGVLIIGPLFFLESHVQSMTGAPISHPDIYYGFVGSTFAWQLAYLVIGRNPGPYRPFMLLGALGKLIYFGSAWTLYAQGRIPMTVPALASPDLLLAILFVAAWVKTRPPTSSSAL